MKHRPSSLPMLAQCALFAGAGGEYADQGTERHQLLAAELREPGSVSLLTDSDEDKAAIEWAAAYIRLHAPMVDYPLIVEERRTWIGPNFEERSGTPDIVCGSHIFDLKWRHRDYSSQMADYALSMLVDEGDAVTVHLLFGSNQHVERIVFTRESAEQVVGDILAKAEDQAAQPTPCDYCGWCAKRLTCPAVLERVNAVVEGRIDWKLDTYHSSEITSAEQMGKALAIARLVEKWAEAVEHHAKEAAKRGDVPAGYKLQEKQGNRFIASVVDAFGVAGISQDEFLKACEVKFSDLVALHAQRINIPKAAAEREMAGRLGPVLQRKPKSVSLVSVKSKTEGEQ
jgi:hypothetical protein